MCGSALALLLSRRGYRVFLCDRDPLPSDMPMSTHFIHPRGIACLTRWGLREHIVATKSAPVLQFELDLGPFSLTGSPPPVDGEAAGFAPRRLLLDGILVRAAVENGAELRDRCQVEGLLRDEGQVTGIRMKMADGSVESLHAQIVVGADGPSSRVASEVGAPEYNSRPALQGTAWVYWEGVPLDHFELHLREFEAIYAFPTSDATLIGANWAIERFRAVRRDVETEYFDLLRRAAPALADAANTAHQVEDKIYLGSTRNFFRKAHGAGWVLLGDAHYKKDPCTAQGITDAFCDAERLAEAINEGLSGKRPLVEALADYERATVEWATPFYELTCQLATFAPPPPDMLAIYTALRGNQEDTDRFIGLLTEATLPGEFFATANVERILQRAQAPQRRP